MMATGSLAAPLNSSITFEQLHTTLAANVPLSYTVLSIPAAVRPVLHIDHRFVDDGIDYGGTLIDQATTANRWGAAVGRKVEHWLDEHAAEAIGFCPTNFGWQRGAFLVDHGKLVTLAGDSPTDHELWVIGWDGKWGAHRGRADQLGTELGFEMPAIVLGGQALELHDILDHPRLLFDLRNVFDIAQGVGPTLPARFWELVRKVLPSTVQEAQMLLSDQPVLVPLQGRLSAEDAEELAVLIISGGLTDTLSIVNGALRIVGPLPLQRLPLLGIGVREDASLIVLAIDGRQKDLPGGTISELAQLMLRQGAVEAGLGCAGGDVALVHKQSLGGYSVLNSPSNRDPSTTSGMCTRRVPAAVVFDQPVVPLESKYQCSAPSAQAHQGGCGNYDDIV